MRTEIRIPGRDHVITIAPAGQRVTVHVGEHAIAESDTALTLFEAGYAPVQYLPIGDVDTTSIEPSDTETYCPYKGEATYYSISLPDTKITDAIWTYVSPYESVKRLRDTSPSMTARTGSWSMSATRRQRSVGAEPAQRTLEFALESGGS